MGGYIAMNRTSKFTLAILSLFAATTLWAVTVTGVFEKADLDVDHYNAGAASNLLLVRGLGKPTILGPATALGFPLSHR